MKQLNENTFIACRNGAGKSTLMNVPYDLDKYNGRKIYPEGKTSVKFHQGYYITME